MISAYRCYHSPSLPPWENQLLICALEHTCRILLWSAICFYWRNHNGCSHTKFTGRQSPLKVYMTNKHLHSCWCWIWCFFISLSVGHLELGLSPTIINLDSWATRNVRTLIGFLASDHLLCCLGGEKDTFVCLWGLEEKLGCSFCCCLEKLRAEYGDGLCLKKPKDMWLKRLHKL